MRTEILKMPLRRTAPVSVSTWIPCVLVYLLYHGGSAVQGSPVPVVGVGPNLLLDTPIVAIGRCRVECMKKVSLLRTRWLDYRLSRPIAYVFSVARKGP